MRNSSGTRSCKIQALHESTKKARSMPRSHQLIGGHSGSQLFRSAEYHKSKQVLNSKCSRVRRVPGRNGLCTWEAIWLTGNYGD